MADCVMKQRTFPSTRAWDFVFFDQCIDTGVHDPPEGRRQRIFAACDIDLEAAAAVAAGKAESFSYRPFMLQVRQKHL